MKNKNDQIMVTRVVNAPREVVWRMFTRPEEVKKWWGPRGFTAPVIEIDLRNGGKFKYAMRGAGMDGEVNDFWNVGKFLKILPIDEISSSMSFSDEEGRVVPASYYNMPGDWPMEVIVHMKFEEEPNEKTKITITESDIPEEMREAATMGWEQQLDKLEENL